MSRAEKELHFLSVTRCFGDSVDVAAATTTAVPTHGIRTKKKGKKLTAYSIRRETDIQWGLVVVQDAEYVSEPLSRHDLMIRALKRRAVLASSPVAFDGDPGTVLAYLLLSPAPFRSLSDFELADRLVGNQVPYGESGEGPARLTAPLLQPHLALRSLMGTIPH
ncbi:hypothetical protein DL771_009151 [Monosporascus sp. 5C6A]|nr:hypothetical protein DL771_009151 [Monosporascus sp. 5C6A]